MVASLWLIDFSPREPLSKPEGATEEKYNKDFHKVIQIDERKITDHLGNLVKKSVEETLNAMLYAEVDHQSTLADDLF